MSSNIAPLRLSGLASGIDTSSIVDALILAERQPINLIEQRRRDTQSEEALVKQINSFLTAFREKATNLFEPGAFDAKTAVSADDSILTASAGNEAAKGSYNVTVAALAQAHTMQSTAAPGLAGGDQLDLTVAGETRSYTFEAGDDLQAFADRINADDDAAVSASVVSDRLVLISAESGTAGQITVGGSAAASLGMTATQTAQDAQATVNGVAVTGSGNVISDAIGGLDLTLTGVGSTTLTVGLDTTAIEARAEEFVAAYNTLAGTLRDATRYDDTTQVAGLLQGDQVFSGFVSRLRETVGASVASLAGERYDSLAQIGITSSKEGTLTLDPNAFQAALADDPSGVEAVFAAVDGLARMVDDASGQFVSSVIDTRLDGFTTRIRRFDERIAAMEERLADKEDRLRRQFAASELAIAGLQAQQTSLLQGLSGLGLTQA